MTYSITTSNAGNLAIESHAFDLPVSLAKSALSHLDARAGTYWGNNLAAPTRRAIRAKSATVRVYTAGFSTGELANVLAVCGGHRA